MMKWHICNSAFLSPSPAFCEPFWWIIEPKRRGCGNAQISTWLAQSVVAWGHHVWLASERGQSHRGSPLTPQDRILCPGGYNQTLVTGDPGGTRKNRESTKLKMPKMGFMILPSFQSSPWWSPAPGTATTCSNRSCPNPQGSSTPWVHKPAVLVSLLKSCRICSPHHRHHYSCPGDDHLSLERWQ